MLLCRGTASQTLCHAGLEFDHHMISMWAIIQCDSNNQIHSMNLITLEQSIQSHPKFKTTGFYWHRSRDEA